MDYTPIRCRTFEERENILRKDFTQYLGELAVNTLITNGFLTAPASTKYHGNYEGGLFDHSLNVTRALLLMTENNDLKWGDERSPFVVGIIHDLCKIDQYMPVLGAEKDEYTFNDDPVIKGHGVKSVIYAQAMGIRLSDEERACIIYHMGAFTPKEEWRDYTHAVNVYPNVLWTHHADMIASHIEEV